MSAPFADLMRWAPFAVLVASLAGSAHCVSMCGGLVAATARTPLSWLAYQLGRLSGYLCLGALAGMLGERLLGTADGGLLGGGKWVALGVAMVLGAAFLVAGIRVWQGRPPHLTIVPRRLLSWPFRQAHGRSAAKTHGNALAVGLMTAFLPCGWLHAFVLGAVATRSAVLGAGFLLAFWLGTLPALAAAPWLLHRVFRPLSRRSPRIAGMLLILAGALTVGTKLLAVLPFGAGGDGKVPAHCHPPPTEEASAHSPAIHLAIL